MISMQSLRRFFLPPRALGHYVARLYVSRFLGILLGLVTVLQLLDMLAQQDAIMSAEGATFFDSMGQYLAWRSPQIISQFTPFSALLATLLVLGALNQHSEIIVMKASGLSAQRILWPMGLVSIGIAMVHFLFNETYMVQTSAKLQYWQDNEYAVDLPPPPEYAVRARLVENNTMVLVGSVNRTGGATFLDKISLYDLDDQGNVTSLARANFAVHNNGEWTLFEVRRFDPQTHRLELIDNMPWDLNIDPERFLLATVNPDHVSVITLWRAIVRLKAEGVPTDALLSSFFHKFSMPAATLLMPLLGALAGFGVHRGGTLLIRAVAGMALGFAFFVADNFMLAMGEFGVAPPFLAATAPIFLFASLGFAVLFYTEE